MLVKYIDKIKFNYAMDEYLNIINNKFYKLIKAGYNPLEIKEYLLLIYKNDLVKFYITF